MDAVLQNIIAQHSSDERAVEALGQTAWAYRKLEQPAKARTVYRYVVDHWPRADRAVFSQRGVILCSIALGDEAAAEAGVRKLLAEYADSKYMPEIVRNIAMDYYRRGQWGPAAELHRYVASNHPQVPEALLCQRDAALCHVEAANEEAVEITLQKLVTEFADDARLPGVLAGIGEHYRKKGDLQNARNLHQYVSQRFSGSAEAIQSQRNAILCSVGLNDEPQIEAGIGTLLAQFGREKDIAPVVAYVADRLGDSRDEAKGKLYQYLIDRHPRHELVVPAKARLGQIMIRRGDDTGAEALFQRILRDHQGHPRLAEAVHLMADGYLD